VGSNPTGPAMIMRIPIITSIAKMNKVMTMSATNQAHQPVLGDGRGLVSLKLGRNFIGYRRAQIECVSIQKMKGEK